MFVSRAPRTPPPVQFVRAPGLTPPPPFSMFLYPLAYPHACTQGGKLADGLDIIMSLERLCRVGNDFPNLKEVILTAARLCRQVEDWPQLNTTLTLLSKRREQHSKAVTAMVQEVRRAYRSCVASAHETEWVGSRCSSPRESLTTATTDGVPRDKASTLLGLVLFFSRPCLPQAMGWLDETPNKEARVLLLVALRDITDGKIFVEAERAKLTRMLAKVRYVSFHGALLVVWVCRASKPLLFVRLVLFRSGIQQ